MQSCSGFLELSSQLTSGEPATSREVVDAPEGCFRGRAVSLLPPSITIGRKLIPVRNARHHKGIAICTVTYYVRASVSPLRPHRVVKVADITHKITELSRNPMRSTVNNSSP